LEKINKRYRLALRFASQYNSYYRYDIVHEAWLKYFDRTGLDLFMIELRDEAQYIYTIIKRAFHYWWYHERTGDKYIYGDVDEQLSKEPSADEILDVNEKLLTYQKALQATASTTGGREIFKNNGIIIPLLFEGYSQVDIAEKMGVTKAAVNYFFGKWKKIIKRRSET
jgi:DNA-directed RNA polymerase specialized sigma24 family protein